MTHRSAGVDQILRHPGRPAIQEPVMRDVRGYVALAEAVKCSPPSQGRRCLHLLGWRDSTNRAACRWRRGGDPGGQRDATWSKGTNYRMHPVNVSSRTTPCGHSSRDALSLPPSARPLEVDIPSRRVLA